MLTMCKLDGKNPNFIWKVFYLHIGMQLEVSCLVANSKVVLGHLGFGSVKGHLVTSEPPLVANNGSSVDGGASEVKVDITTQVDELALVGGLNFATLLAVDERHGKLIAQLKLQQLVN